VRTLADVRALLRRGDADAALAGLYRLRRAKPPARESAAIATLLGHLYFDRRWWTDALKEYRFAVTLSPRAKSDATLANNAVRLLGQPATYGRARRLLLVYVGKPALPSLRRAAKGGATPLIRRRAAELQAQLEGRKR
jgi:uncharacterized protein HemY